MLLTGILITAIVSALVWAFIMPRKLDGTFSVPFLQGLHDFFHMKKRYAAELLKILFLAATVGCIVFGILLLGYDLWMKYVYVWKLGGYVLRVFRFRGLLLMLLGPVAVRVVQEVLMAPLLAADRLDQMNARLKALEEKQKAPEEVKNSHRQNSLRREN